MAHMSPTKHSPRSCRSSILDLVLLGLSAESRSQQEPASPSPLGSCPMPPPAPLPRAIMLPQAGELALAAQGTTDGPHRPPQAG